MDQSSFDELAAYFCEQQANMMQRWRELVHEHGAFPASAERLTNEELEDHLPDLIEQIAEVFRGHGTTGVEEKASRHGHERRLLGYELPLILIELRLFRQVLLDATDRWFEGQRGRLDHTDERAAVFMILSVIDISLSASAQRYTDEAESERNLAAEALVERTQELERYSQKLEAVSREKDRFLAMLSHELRNPIAPILSAAYLLKHASLPPPLVRARDVIERQARHLTRLVDDLLEVNRMLIGKINLQKEPCDLVDAAKQAAEVCAGNFDAKSISFDLRLKIAKAPLLADSVRIVQIITNLLTNAAKFTPAGGHVVLTVDQQDGLCVCQLRDNGVGVEPEMLPRIFEMFTQVDTSLDRAHGGLGIGLSLAKYLVEAHGGQIRRERRSREGNDLHGEAAHVGHRRSHAAHSRCPAGGGRRGQSRFTVALGRGPRTQGLHGADRGRWTVGAADCRARAPPGVRHRSGPAWHGWLRSRQAHSAPRWRQQGLARSADRVRGTR